MESFNMVKVLKVGPKYDSESEILMIISDTHLLETDNGCGRVNRYRVWDNGALNQGILYPWTGVETVPVLKAKL